MGTARVFRSGNSQAVRLPKQFRLTSKEVEILRRGDEIVLREKVGNMVRAFDLLADVVIADREKDRPQRRKKLSEEVLRRFRKLRSPITSGKTADPRGSLIRLIRPWRQFPPNEALNQT
jgi:antitoxin VapB